MKARDVIRTNSNCEFWDVPGTDKMVHCYRTYGGRMVYEVIEPSSVMGRHQTIMFLSDGQTEKCYGTVSTLRADDALSGLEGAEREKAYRTWVSALYWQCYGIIVSVGKINMLLDSVKTDMGRIEITGKDR